MATPAPITATYPTPTPGASLILAFRPSSPQTFLVIGSGTLAATRATAALEAGYNVVVSDENGLPSACEEVRWRVSEGQITWLDWTTDVLEQLPNVVLVAVTDTLLSKRKHSVEAASAIAQLCRAKRIPVNVSDMPSLCDFTFAATHRVRDRNGRGTALQIGVTANGKACRLASRIKREIVAGLHSGVGVAVENVAKLRSIGAASTSSEDEEETEVGVSLNAPVTQDSGPEVETTSDAQRRKMRWIAQLSEYWPYDKLAGLTEVEMRETLERYKGGSIDATQISGSEVGSPRHNLRFKSAPISKTEGRIILVGSGPGHPSLLTVAARKALVEQGTLILSDKLVPTQVLELIPQGKRLYIAKKYPGNADVAQNELLDMALEGLKNGEVVVRLKQGDPFLYGRGGEEVLFFRSHGYDPLVIPGVSSALAGPLMAGIPVTQRGVSDSVTICTGVGRGGKEVELPGYERGRSLVILMGVARLAQLVQKLFTVGYPRWTPIAVIERASCADQRVISSSLERIETVMSAVDEQRAPSMIFVGMAALALTASGTDNCADKDESLSAKSAQTNEEEARVSAWLGMGSKCIVTEGLPNADLWRLF